MWGLFWKAIAATLIGLVSIGHFFWNYTHPHSKWESTADIDLYGGILLVCVGSFVAIRNYRRLRKGPPASATGKGI